MLNFGLGEIIVVGVVALVFVGPERLPEMLRYLGKMYGKLRAATYEIRREFTIEVDRVVNHIKNQAIFDRKNEISLSEDNIGSSLKEDLISSNNDELYSKAIEIVVKQQKVSTSYIQRYLQIGYNRAERIIDMMEAEGIVSKANHVGKRDVL